MKKIILLIAMIFLLISCSNNNYIKTGFSQNEKQELVLFKDRIKNNLSENNLAYIKENTKDSCKWAYILIRGMKVLRKIKIIKYTWIKPGC